MYLNMTGFGKGCWACWRGEVRVNFNGIEVGNEAENMMIITGLNLRN